MLEQIVKMYVPFTGVHSSVGSDEKGRFVIPKPLIVTLKERQKTEEKGEIKLFYRLHTMEIPKYLELTDYLPENKNPNFPRYRRIARLDEDSRTLVSPDDLIKIGVTKDTPVVFVGSGHKIFVYKVQDYEIHKATSYMSLDAIQNLFVRASERFSLPLIR